MIEKRKELIDMGMVFNNQTLRYEFIPDNMPMPSKPNQGLLWVSGEVGAKSWIVPPNQTALLMDSECDKFYIKSSDNAGMPTLRTFEYKEVTPQQGKTTPSGMNFEEEINALKEQLKALTEKISQYEVENDG